jgi:hypothetical protein
VWYAVAAQLMEEVRDGLVAGPCWKGVIRVENPGDVSAAALTRYCQAYPEYGERQDTFELRVVQVGQRPDRVTPEQLMAELEAELRRLRERTALAFGDDAVRFDDDVLLDYDVGRPQQGRRDAC